MHSDTHLRQTDAHRGTIRSLVDRIRTQMRIRALWNARIQTDPTPELGRCSLDVFAKRGPDIVKAFGFEPDSAAILMEIVRELIASDSHLDVMLSYIAWNDLTHTLDDTFKLYSPTEATIVAQGRSSYYICVSWYPPSLSYGHIRCANDGLPLHQRRGSVDLDGPKAKSVSSMQILMKKILSDLNVDNGYDSQSV